MPTCRWLRGAYHCCSSIVDRLCLSSFLQCNFECSTAHAHRRIIACSVCPTVPYIISLDCGASNSMDPTKKIASAPTTIGNYNAALQVFDGWQKERDLPTLEQLTAAHVEGECELRLLLMDFAKHMAQDDIPHQPRETSSTNKGAPSNSKQVQRKLRTEQPTDEDSNPKYSGNDNVSF
jgi:hypothetical protein